MDISEAGKLALTGLLALLFSIPFVGVSYATRESYDSTIEVVSGILAFIALMGFVICEFAAGAKLIWG
jgi:hypothetical protein